MIEKQLSSNNPACQVLIVDPEFQKLNTSKLGLIGIEITCASTHKSASSILPHTRFDLAVIQRNLADGDGLALLKEVKKINPEASVILLHEEDDLSDKLYCLSNGANEYLKKSDIDAEFIVRIHMQLRRVLEMRRSKSAGSLLKYGNLTIHLDTGKAYLLGEDLNLTQIEFKLLKYLAKNSGVVISRKELLQEVWGYKYSGYEHTLNSHMNRLRIKLKSNPESQQFISTMRSQGYTFSAPQLNN